MNKKYIRFLFVIPIIYFLLIVNIKAVVEDLSAGQSGNIGNLGSGNWYTGYIGLKISIVSENNVPEDTEIIVNDDDLKNTKFSTKMRPKTMYDENEYQNIKWSYNATTYKNSGLPYNGWLYSDNTQVNIYELLQEKNYKLLKNILEQKSKGKKIFETLSNGDYILIEPMALIGDYYGTAFELLHAFAGNLSTCNEYFCYWYTGAVFGGDESGGKGVLYNTLYVPSTVKIGKYELLNVGAWTKKNSSSIENLATYKKLNKCLASKSCGRGIGVFKYSDLYESTPDNPTPPSPIPTLDCKTQLENLKKIDATPPANKLVDLYLSLEKKYPGLLNFDNPTCSTECSQKNETSCLTGKHGNSNMDFSCSDYIERDSAGVKVDAFCKKTVELRTKYPIEEISNPGRFIYLTKRNLLESNLIQVCYSKNKINEKNLTFVSYDEIVKDVFFGGKRFAVSTISNGNVVTTPLENNEGYIYEKSITKGYNFKTIRTFIGSGKIVEDEDDCIVYDGNKRYTICRNIGQGITTKFNSINYNLNFDFSYKYDGNSYKASCPVVLTKELVECKDKNNCELNLDFHTIKSNSTGAFLKKDGADKRMRGTNWCTPLKNKILNDRNDSYNKLNSAPLYKITLTPNTIREIRNYNKENEYNDFKFKCTIDDLKCESEFLKNSKIFNSDNFEKNNPEWQKTYKFKCGDVNLDGKVTIKDATMLEKNESNFDFACEAIYFNVADVNSDGVIDVKDIYKIKAKVSKTGDPLICTGENIINEG